MIFPYFVIFILSAVELSKGFGGYWSKGKKESPCSSYSNKLLSLLNILCNTTQTTSVTARDACYGCFFRAGSLPGGSTQLTSLSQCATLYLTGTEYATCSTELAAIVSGIRPTTPPTTTSCYTGYCDFVRCVRRINANNLIDGCVSENLVNRNLSLESNRVGFFTNVTSCILARARCSAYNPITGELQNQLPVQYSRGIGSFVGGLLNQGGLYNSLQISSAGDIRIISFPATVSVADLFCSRMVGLEQSSYGSDIC